MAFVSCSKHNTDLATKQAKLLNCDGDALPGGTQIPSCSEVSTAIAAVETAVAAALATKQGNLLKCDGTALPAGTKVATCEDIPALPDVSVYQLKLKKCDGTDLPAAANIPTCQEIPALVKDNETVTTLVLDSVSGHYKHTNEAGTSQLIEPGNLISSTAGNAIATGTDGKLTLSIPAQLPDDQVLSGDNSGNVGLELTPVTDPVSGDINYTIKADLKVATTTPSGGANALVIGASGAYVAEATATTLGTVTLNQVEALAKVVGQDEGVATSATAEAVKTFNFVGAGVTAEQTGSVLKVTVPGGGAADGTTFGTAVTDFNSSAPTDGNTFYRNTTTGELWKWDGVKWTPIGDQISETGNLTTLSIPDVIGVASNNLTKTMPRNGTISVAMFAITNQAAIGMALQVTITLNGSIIGISRGTSDDAWQWVLSANAAATVDVVAGDIIGFAQDTRRQGTVGQGARTSTGKWSYGYTS